MRFKLNGTQTLAENMADNIGLKQSWMAYKIFQKENNVQLPGLNGFSNDQLFFLAYANVSRKKVFSNFVCTQVCSFVVVNEKTFPIMKKINFLEDKKSIYFLFF